MVLPAGTYHNASLTITPFTSDPVNKDATTGEPFTYSFIGNLVIKRSQYTDCGTLPLTGPSSEQPDEPEVHPSQGSRYLLCRRRVRYP